LPVREEGARIVLLALLATSGLHFGVAAGLGTGVALSRFVAGVPPHLVGEMERPGQVLPASRTPPLIAALVHALFATTSLVVWPSCFFPLRNGELVEWLLESTHTLALPFFFTAVAPNIGWIFLSPRLRVEHVFRKPVTAVLALFLNALVPQRSLTVLTIAPSVFATPLLLRELRFERFCFAAFAHMGRHMLLLDSLPIYGFASQRAQQQFWPFEIALTE